MNLSLLIHVGFSITGKDVSEILERTCEAVGYPEYIQCDNGTFRNECLNAHYFKKLSPAREIISYWWKEYNEERP